MGILQKPAIEHRGLFFELSGDVYVAFPADKPAVN
jgi:hypothetical protein